MKTSILTLLIISFVASPVFSQERYKKTSAPLTEQQIEQRFELPCLPYWAEHNELNVHRLRCPKP